MILIGAPSREAVRAGLALTPMGEFGFIIAQAGITAAVVPPSFYPLAVGVSLLTALACPALVNRSEKIAHLFERLEPRFVRNGISYYQNWAERVSSLPGENRVWRLSRRRLIQIVLGVLFISGLLIVAEPLYRVLAATLGEDLFFRYGTAFLFWGALGIIVLFPLFAAWRNISAVAMLLAEATSRERREKALDPGQFCIRATGCFCSGIAKRSKLPGRISARTARGDAGGRGLGRCADGERGGAARFPSCGEDACRVGY